MNRTPSRRAAFAAALLSCLLLPAVFLAQTTGPKALVVCPPSDSAGCDRIAQQLALTTNGGSPVFPGGVDKRYAELRTIPYSQLQSYAVVFVPSLANAPYDILREDAVKTRLQQVLRGRVAVWSGTPDRGTTSGASAGKLTLIQNLARWAAAQHAADGSAGLVVLQDFSDKKPDGTSPRYDWIQGIAGVIIQPDLAAKTYAQVERNAANPAATPIVGSLAYDNIASFGLQFPEEGPENGGWGQTVQGKRTTRGQVVLGTAARSPSACQVVGSGGGTFSFQSDKVVLFFPAGALSEDWCLSVDKANAKESGYVANTAYSFAPSFSFPHTPPATLSIRYAESDIPGGESESDLAIFEFKSGAWAEVPGSSVDAANDSVTAPIDHFSRYAIFVKGSGGGGGGGGGGGKPVGSVSVEPATASVAAGGSQTLTATVRDKNGNPLSGRTVAWSSTNGGSFSTTTGTTNASGQATTELTVVTTAGTQHVVTAAVDNRSGTSTVTVVAGAAAKLGFTVQPTSTGAGASITPAVQVAVQDAHGNTVTGAVNGVTLAITGGTGDPAATLSGTTTVAASGGVATFSDLSIDRIGTGYTLDASAGGLTGATSSAFDITAGNAATIAIHSGDSETLTVGDSHTLEAKVTDAIGNPVSGFSVAWAVASGGGSVSAATSNTNAAGIASIGWTLGTTAGTQTATATASGLSGSPLTFSVTATAGAAAKLAFTQQPTDAGAGVAITPAVQVTVQDAHGNTVTGAVNGVTLAITGGTGDPAATLSGTTTVAASGGVATFSDLSIDRIGTGYTLDASAGGLTGATSSAFDITAGNAATIAIHSGDGETLTVGDSHTLEAKVTDAVGNPVANYSVAWAAASGSVSAASSNTDADGIASIGWTLGTTAGTQTATATASGLSGSPLTFSVTATAGSVSASSSTLATSHASLPADGTSTATLTVQLKDQYGNDLTTGGASVALSTTGGTLSAVSDNGDGTYTATLTAASTIGSATVSGTVGGSPLGNTVDVEFTAGEAANIAGHSGDGVTVPVGGEHTIQAKVTDANGVAVVGYTVSWAATSGGGSVSAGTSDTDSNGVASITWTLGTTAGSQTAEATGAGLSGSPVVFTVTATPGAAAQLAITTQPSASAQAGVAFPQQPVVQVQDQHGNAVAQNGTTVTAAIASGAAALGGTTTVATDAAGQAAFTNLSIDGATGDRTLSFSASGLTGATSNTISVAAGPAATIAVSPSGPTEVPAGNTVAVSGVVADGFGNPVSGAAVAWTSTNGGSFSPAASTSTDATGTATVTFTTSTTAGTVHVVTGTVNGTVTGSTGTITTQGAPVANDDTHASVLDGTSAPGSTPYHIAFNASSSGAIDVLANDDLGYPVAPTRTFGNVQLNGGAALGGAVTANAFGGSAVSLGGGGSLGVTAGGLVNLTPPTGFTGLITFGYRLENVIGSDDATVTVAVGARPVANSKSYPHTLVGNVSINTAGGTPFSVLTGDGGDALTIASVPASDTNGQSTLNLDGTFTFNPATGFRSGNGSFQYTVSNGFGTSPAATVTIPVGSHVIWFVDNNAGACSAGCTGRLSHPFTTLAAFHAVNNGTGTNPADNHHVFLYESAADYTGPVQLRAGQRLIGQDAGSELVTLTGVTLPPHSPALPAMASGNATFTRIVNGSGNGVVLGSGNHLHGLRLGNASGIALSGSAFGTLALGDVRINTSGQALSLTNGTISGSFASLSSSGGTNNVLLSGVATTTPVALGTASDALSGATSDALKIDGGTGSFTFAGPITNMATLAVNVANKTGGAVTLSGQINPAAAARGISVSGNSGGTTVAFSGAAQKISTGTGAGVSLTNNNGATISFTGGALAVATTTGSGFVATGAGPAATSGGTVVVTGASNTITSAGGIALNVANTTIGAGGLNFLSIAANGGSNGIVLNNTGTTAGLTVAGTGSAGSGGTIQNTSIAGISATSARNLSFSWMNLTNANSTDGGGEGVCDGNTNAGCHGAVKLNNVTGVTLDRLAISGSAEQGINGINVTGLTLSNSTITGAGNAVNESGIYIFGLFGTTAAGTANSITNTSVTGSGSANHNVFIRNSTATSASASTPDRLLISGSSFVNPGSVAAPSDGITVSLRGTANFQTVVQNSSFTQATLAHGTDGIQVDAGDSSRSDVSITGSTFTGWNQAPINLSGAGSALTTFNVASNPTISGGVGNGINVIGNNDATMRGTIASNPNVTTATAGNNGIGISLESNNTGAVVVDVNGNTVTGFAYGLRGTTRESGTAEADLTIRNNTITAGGTFPHSGTYLTAGNADGQPNRTCVNLSNNQVSKGAGGFDYVLEQWTGNTFQLQGFAGNGTNSTDVRNFVSSRDIGGATVDLTAGSTVNFTAATCATP